MSRQKLPIVLERTEIDALLRIPNTGCPSGLRNRAILQTMYGAGLRVSEVTKLRPGDIRWEDGVLEIRGGKGGKDRIIPVDSETTGWLRAWDAERPRSGKRFFTTLKGGSISSRYLQMMVKRLARKANLAKADAVTPHVLRHSYATHLLDDGFSIREVQTLLGHSNISTTEIYLHVNPQKIGEKVRNRGKSLDAQRNLTKLAEELSDLPTEVRDALVEILKPSTHGSARP